MSTKTRIMIAGHRGLVGSALWRHFTARGFRHLTGCSRAEVDLRDAAATREFLGRNRVDVLINAAGLVGGIAVNASRPAEFLADNLRIQLNLLDSAVDVGIGRVLSLGSSCIYPKFADQPIREEALLTGPLEPTNEAFAIAKLAGIAHLQAIRRQYGLSYICAMPTNLYGPGDHFDTVSSHVLPAMMRRFHEARETGADVVECWGTGRPRREFLYVDDLADACHFLLDTYDGDLPLNVGTGNDVSIAELAQLVARTVGYRGEVRWDDRKPDGTYRKVLDVRRLTELGWRASTSLEDGVRRTHRWFLDNETAARVS